MDVFSMIDEEAKWDAGLRNSRTCGTVTSNTAVMPMELNIDFGAAGCMDNGHLKQGQIQAYFTGLYTDSTTVVTVTFINYMVDSNLVSGTITLTNMGQLAVGGGDVMNMVVSSGRIDVPDPLHPTWMEWSNDYNIEWTGGAATAGDPTDDVFSIMGTANGRGQKGNTYTTDVMTALSYDYNCDYVMTGEIELQPANLRTRTVNYGSGCNANASVTIKNDSYDITYSSPKP